jgi:hypothetical protein
MIIMRTGGLDGVALQVREYRYLLNHLNIKVFTITGRAEGSSGPLDPIGQKHKVISRLDFRHKDTRLLFANQFTEGPEKEDISRINKEEWLELFETHKAIIKKKLDSILRFIPGNMPVFIFNLVSLRHAHPAAAVALKEIIEKYQERGFISHSADPDAERPEKIERIKDFALEKISAALPGQEYSGGPYRMKNLYHIVLNPTQKRNFINKYKVPSGRVFEIPDFLEFKSRKPLITSFPSKIFMDYLSDRALKPAKDSYTYSRAQISRKMLFFLSPVRPVYRKRIKESMLAAFQYGKKNNIDVAYVVTHPNKDDMDYFLKTVEFADRLGLKYYHLGQTFSLKTLENVYDNFVPLKTIGVVSSSSGGWENALNEMARAGIPFYMNVRLNSFLPLTRKIGIISHGTDFSTFTGIIEQYSPEELAAMDFSENREMKKAFSWFDSLLDENYRKEVIIHNYRKAYNYLSYKAVKPKLLKALKRVLEKGESLALKELL